MDETVATPKLFLRGNRWYVRVQVPKSMQDVLNRKEYWVALKTADRSVALGTAVVAAQRKRNDFLAEFERLLANQLTKSAITPSRLNDDVNSP